MSATFHVRSFRPNDGIRQVHLTRDQGQPSEVLLNLTVDDLASIFEGGDVRGGDTWELSARLVSRAGSNGIRPSPLSQKFGG